MKIVNWIELNIDNLISPNCIQCATGWESCIDELPINWNLWFPNYTWSSLTNKCIVLQCLSNQYINLGVCQDWDIACATWTAETSLNCLTCSKGYEMILGECVRNLHYD